VVNLRADSSNSWSIVVGFVIVAIACALAYTFSPKGENQTSDPSLLSSYLAKDW
jgi:hypothetical protein